MSSAVAERPPRLSERQLTEIWEGQRLPKAALQTRQGERLQVVFRGQRGRGPGPDFRNAIIATGGGRLLHGDIELHIKSSDFQNHGHHLDPNYDHVVLHVVFWDDRGQDTTLSSGEQAPVIVLGEWVARRAAELAAWLEKPSQWKEPCRSAVERAGKRDVSLTLDRLGERRFAHKSYAFRKGLDREEGDSLLYRSLLEAMGYGGDRSAFLALSELAPWAQLRAALDAAPGPHKAETAEALLLGAAGFLPAEPATPYACSLEERWAKANSATHLPPEVWRKGNVRPANLPQRRLAGLARILSGQDNGLVQGMLDTASHLSTKLTAPEACFTVPAEGFWRTCLDLSGRRCGSQPPALIGRSRAIELMTNCLLPFCHAWAMKHDDERLARSCLDIYKGLPRASAYGETAFLERNLGRKALVAGASRQQALLYLSREYCSRGGCGRCPLS